jgi:hypothetical protein
MRTVAATATMVAGMGGTVKATVLVRRQEGKGHVNPPELAFG